jgi:uncharacterized protein (DUF983 family)
MPMSDPGNRAIQTAGQSILSGLRGRCPRCGKGQLFTAYLKITERCNVCGLSFAGHDVGDGPVVPAILVIGGIVVGLAWMVENAFQPPLWVHAALWGPLTIGFSLGMLPLLKGLSVALQFRFRSTEEEPKPGGG